jgi:hypothetical protein
MDAVELLNHDHRAMEGLLREYGTAASDSERRRAAKVVVREIFKHTVLEKLIVYPLAKDVVPEEKRAIDGCLKACTHINFSLVVVDRLLSDGSYPWEATDKLMTDIRQQVQEHIREDQKVLLPRLAENLDQSVLEEFGILLEQAKHFAPTRPHLNMPDEPPALALAAPVAAAFDRMRDRLRGRPQT